ncbi:hypothetical protein ABZ863_00075 [Saccharomonospora sp. NPDC046836]|uniref:hypothetical protein n=1 Tax=Saccharomonospora sp. NPDC046836 TaxID=3156921 RepID=UPI0033EE00E5
MNNCRNGVDVFTLIAGIATLCVSGYILADGPQWLTGMELRWLLAGGAVLVGALMLIASVRGGRRNNGSDKPPR